MQRNTFRILFLIGMMIWFIATFSKVSAANTTYYVSSSGGNDSNNGLSTSTPFRTISKVNSLNLQPGDRVLFRCDDTWRAEMLTITKSGASGNPITFGAYPDGCVNKPILSGAQPIAGWSLYSGNIYVANLSAGANAGKFTNGINQVFRNNQRLTMGRWPNLNSDGSGGYSTIDAQPAGNQITDNELPAGDWTGAVVHIRGMRWYILNRKVQSDSGSTLTLGSSAGCWGGNCTGWGFFLNNHLSTLDQEGEWYYNTTTKQLFLCTTGGAPADNQIEGSVILKTDDRAWGGVQLGPDYGSSIAYVVVENLDVRRWFRDGIASPTNFAGYENHDITLRQNVISDVDEMGINLATWVYSAADGRPDGWRGGYAMTISNNTIERANSMGINSYARQSTISSNTIRDVAIIANLGAAGMGCSFTDGEGGCTEDGDGIRIKIDQANDTGNTNTITGNRLERIGYNGMDVFGHHNTIERNVIVQPCYSKGDCGAVRTFGRDNLTATAVHDLTFNQNILVDSIGNTDGCNSTYQALFGFGLYIDNYSRDVAITNNTIISSTAAGILYQNSTGTVTGNTLYNNSRGSMYSAQVDLTASPTYASSHTGNVLYGLKQNARTLEAADRGRLGTSNNNYFFNPYSANNISVEGDRSLASWQSFSGKDAQSKKNWFTQNVGDASLSKIFYNDTANSTTIDLGSRKYLDLDQNNVIGSITLAPYTSKVLIDNGQASLTLLSMTPSMWGVNEAANFTLTVNGAGFTSNSVVRWNGSARPTTFVSGSRLTAAISASDVSAIANIPVTVYDPSPAPSGTETAPLTFRVVQSVLRIYLPFVFR